MRSLQSICYALKQARIDQGLTQKTLANKARVSRAWLIGLESGTATRAEFGKIFDVATALGLEFCLVPCKKLKPDDELILERMFGA